MPSFLSKIFRRKDKNGGESKKKSKKTMRSGPRGKRIDDRSQTSFPSRISSPSNTGQSPLNMEIPIHHDLKESMTPLTDKDTPPVRHVLVDLDNSSFEDSTTDGGMSGNLNDENMDMSNGNNLMSDLTNNMEQPLNNGFPGNSRDRSSRGGSGRVYKNYQLSSGERAQGSSSSNGRSSPTSAPQLTNKWLQQHHQNQPSGEHLLLQRLGGGGGLDAFGHPGDPNDPGSPTSSSDFCLSTDQEDEEYNKMRAQSCLTKEPESPNSDTTEEYVVFPGLTGDVVAREGRTGSNNIHIEPMAHETEDDLRAWTPSPPRAGTTATFGSPRFSFEGDDDEKPLTITTQRPPSPSPNNSNNVNHKPAPATDFFQDTNDSDYESSSFALAGESLVSTSSSHENSTGFNRAPIDHTANALTLASLPSLTSDDGNVQGGLKISTRAVSPSPEANASSITPASSSPSASPSPPTQTLNKKSKRKKRRKEKDDTLMPLPSSSQQLTFSEDPPLDPENSWLFDEVTDTLGPRGIAADMESLSGRSNRSRGSRNSAHGGRSVASHRSSRSRTNKNSRRSQRAGRSDGSVGSKSHRSTRSQMSQMSDASRSVANDLLRLEMQLAMAGSNASKKEFNGGSSRSVGHYKEFGTFGGSVDGGRSRTSYSSVPVGSMSVGGDTSRSRRRTKGSSAKVSSRRNRLTIVAPPGKLGIILANKFDSKGTVISGVRSSSVLADKIFPGDRIISIDGEDVSRMTVSEITTIMARKNEFERTLTVLTTPKGSSSGAVTTNTTAITTTTQHGAHYGSSLSHSNHNMEHEYVGGGGVSDNGSLVSNTMNSTYLNYRR